MSEEVPPSEQPREQLPATEALGTQKVTVSEALSKSTVDALPQFTVSGALPRFAVSSSMGRVISDLTETLMRHLLAFLFVILFGGTITIAVFRTSNWTELKQLLDLALPAETALLGSAVGFYFGTRKRDGGGASE